MKEDVISRNTIHQPLMDDRTLQKIAKITGEFKKAIHNDTGMEVIVAVSVVDKKRGMMTMVAHSAIKQSDLMAFPTHVSHYIMTEIQDDL